MTRFLAWLSTHWNKRRTSQRERQLAKEQDMAVNRSRDLSEQLDISQSRCRVLEEQVKQMAAATAFMQQRWETATSNLAGQVPTQQEGLRNLLP